MARSVPWAVARSGGGALCRGSSQKSATTGEDVTFFFVTEAI